MVNGASALGLAVTLAILATLGYLPQQTVAPYLSFVGGSGNLTVVNSIGSSPITGMTIQMPEDIAKSITVPASQNGWTAQPVESTIILTGGNLQAGESFSLRFVFTRYVPPGTSQIKVTGTTADGNQFSFTGRMIVQEFIILDIINALSSFSLPMFAGSGLLALAFVLSNVPQPSKRPTFPKDSPERLRVEVEAELKR